MSQQQNQLSPHSLLHSLYCDEDVSGVSLFETDEPRKLHNVDFYWEDEELVNLLTKQHSNPLFEDLKKEQTLTTSRRRAVDWLRRVLIHYSFSTSTAVLSVNYFDRFVSELWSQMSSPWMSQLAAVACLSLAAKMEEIEVPLLLDLQVEESEYLFEAKTIQRMEMSVLSSLNWRLSPVTPVSFIDHIARRIGFVNLSQVEFVLNSESVLLCILYDDRYVEYMPSEIAGSVMIHVVRSLDPSNADEFHYKILDLLTLDQERIESCSSMIMEVTSKRVDTHFNQRLETAPLSPKGVMEVSFSSDSSNDSWTAVVPSPSLTPDSEPLLKKCKTNAHSN